MIDGWACRNCAKPFVRYSTHHVTDEDVAAVTAALAIGTMLSLPAPSLSESQLAFP